MNLIKDKSGNIKFFKDKKLIGRFRKDDNSWWIGGIQYSEKDFNSIILQKELIKNLSKKESQTKKVKI